MSRPRTVNSWHFLHHSTVTRRDSSGHRIKYSRSLPVILTGLETRIHQSSSPLKAPSLPLCAGTTSGSWLASFVLTAAVSGVPAIAAVWSFRNGNCDGWVSGSNCLQFQLPQIRNDLGSFLFNFLLTILKYIVKADEITF